MSSKAESPKARKSILGDAARVHLNERVSLTTDVVARDYSATGLAAAEAVLDIAWTIHRPLSQIWPKFKDFNFWQNPHGYYWDGAVGDEEGNFVFMSDKVSSYGVGTAYAIRKVIPCQLIYLESLPAAYGEGGAWAGHNVMSFAEKDSSTYIAIYMDHTWQSATLGIEELMEVAKSAVEAAAGFWGSSFIPKLEELL